MLRASDAEQSIRCLCLVHALLTNNDELVNRVNALVDQVSISSSSTRDMLDCCWVMVEVIVQEVVIIIAK